MDKLIEKVKRSRKYVSEMFSKESGIRGDYFGRFLDFYPEKVNSKFEVLEFEGEEE